MKENQEVSRAFELIIARAIMDSVFRERLLCDKQSVIQEYNLTGYDIEALERVDAASLEEARELAQMIPVVHLRSDKQE